MPKNQYHVGRGFTGMYKKEGVCPGLFSDEFVIIIVQNLFLEICLMMDILSLID